MITNRELFELIVDTVPQWFISENEATYKIKINLNGEEYYISAFRNATPELYSWLDKCSSLSSDLVMKNNTYSKFTDKQLIQSKLVLEWLKINNYEGEWDRIFDYSREMDCRTYENSTIGFTFIYDANSEGSIDIIANENQKIIDVLAETHNTYFKLGKGWRFIDYNYVKASELKTVTDYKLLPEFLFPYQSVLKQGQCAITKTKRGDLIIYDIYGLIASNRKGQWKIYEPRALKNTLVDLLPGYYIGCNLFEVVFDLSYRRHGALILFDLEDNYKDVISNSTSLLDGTGSSLHNALSNRLKEINVNKADNKIVSKQLLLELASVDGALVFSNNGSLLAFGAIIKTHLNAKGEIGARSTAALSAHYYGMRAFKISSDGEIVMYYDIVDEEGNKELIKIKFL